MNANQAIMILATQNSDIDIDKARETLADAVFSISEYGDPDDSMMDWLSAGDYTGKETAESIAAEWDSLFDES